MQTEILIGILSSNCPTLNSDVDEEKLTYLIDFNDDYDCKPSFSPFAKLEFCTDRTMGT